MTNAPNIEPTPQATTLRRQESNSQAFLDMEPQVHDLHRFTTIAYDYVLRVFDELREIREEAIIPEVDRHLSPEQEEHVTFLLEQIAKATAKLPEFYGREIEA
jgi:hypothetical protein